MNFEKWLLIETVEEQKQFLTKKLLSKFFPESVIDQVILILSKAESDILSENDKRKSFTINKFVNSIIWHKEHSVAHNLDLIKKAVSEAVNKANLKDPNTREKNVIDLLKKKLPHEDEEIINNLAQNVLKKNQNLDQVVNFYLASKKAASNTKLVAKHGPFELLEIHSFDSDGFKEKHLDTKEQSDCHVLFRGTKWCVRFKDYFDDYISGGPLYLIRENGKPLLLGQENNKFLDVDDNEPDVKELERVFPVILKSKNPELIKWFFPLVSDGLVGLKKLGMSDEMINSLLKGFFNGNVRLFDQDKMFVKSFTKKQFIRFFEEKTDHSTDIDNIDNSYVTLEELVDRLNYSVANKIEKYLDDTRDDSISEEKWDEMELIDKVKLNDNLQDILRDAYHDTLEIYLNKSYEEYLLDLAQETIDSPFNVMKLGDDFIVYLNNKDTMKEAKNYINNYDTINTHHKIEDDIDFSVNKNVKFDFDPSNLSSFDYNKKVIELINN